MVLDEINLSEEVAFYLELDKKQKSPILGAFKNFKGEIFINNFKYTTYYINCLSLIFSIIIFFMINFVITNFPFKEDSFKVQFIVNNEIS